MSWKNNTTKKMAKYASPEGTTDCQCGASLRHEEMIHAATDTAHSYWCPNCNHVLMFIQAPYIPEGIIKFDQTA